MTSAKIDSDYPKLVSDCLACSAAVAVLKRMTAHAAIGQMRCASSRQLFATQSSIHPRLAVVLLLLLMLLMKMVMMKMMMQRMIEVLVCAGADKMRRCKPS